MPNTDSFLELSKVLTGESQLDPRLSEQYRDRLNAAYPKELAELEAAFHAMPGGPDIEAKLKALLDERRDLARLARQLITLWYTAQFTGPDNKTYPPESEEQYVAGLLWRVIKAHPPGYAEGLGGYGYWTKHPDELDTAGQRGGRS